MDPKKLLVHMAQRLYADIRFVTEQNPTQIVDDDGAKAYNSLLVKARKHFPSEFIDDFGEWSPRTIKYKDALVVAGQFCALLEAQTRDLFPTAQPRPRPGPLPPQATPFPGGSPTQPAGAGPAGAPPSASGVYRKPGPEQFRTEYDEELYGPKPAQKNPEGIVPFTLE